jgi:hypothetical protein
VNFPVSGTGARSGELARQRFEYGIDIRGRYAGRECVDQGIVGRQAARLSEQRRLIAHQGHHLFQVRGEQFEIVGLARLDPEEFRPRRRLRQARDQGRRSRNGMVALPAHLAQVGERPILELRRAGLGALQQPGNLRGGEQGMVFGLERGQLLAAHVGAAARHHHRRVPAQQGQCTAKRVQAAKFLFQLVVGSQCHDQRARGARTNFWPSLYQTAARSGA